MKDVNGPGDFLAWLGGGDLKILAQAPGYERTRFIQMAIVLLTTSGIGTLSMMFALHDGVHTSLAVAIIGGLVWGFIILNLDRFLVLSMGHSRDWKRLLLMALPRLGLAAVISMVVATPMTLRIFANDIQNEMVQVNASESQQVAQQQLQTGPATQADAILTKINTDKQILAGHLQGTVSNPEVTFWQDKVNTLTPQVKQAQTAMDNAQAAYQCEVDGSGPGCEGASNLQGERTAGEAEEDGVRARPAELPEPELPAAVRRSSSWRRRSRRRSRHPGRHCSSSRRKRKPSFPALKTSTTSSRPS